MGDPVFQISVAIEALAQEGSARIRAVVDRGDSAVLTEAGQELAMVVPIALYRELVSEDDARRLRLAVVEAEAQVAAGRTLTHEAALARLGSRVRGG